MCRHFLRVLEERSPLNRADRIVRPLLIGQGANDVRGKAAEAEQIVAAMRQHGIPGPMSAIAMKVTASAGRKTAAPSKPSWKRSSRRISADAASRSATISRAPRSSSNLAAS